MGPYGSALFRMDNIAGTGKKKNFRSRFSQTGSREKRRDSEERKFIVVGLDNLVWRKQQ